MATPRLSHLKILMTLLISGVLTQPLWAAEIRWFELISEDAEAANKFYRELFGWKITRTSTGAWLATLNGKEIAGISQIDEINDEVDESQWFPAFKVPDLHVTVERARDAGAEIVESITFVKGFGDYAVIRDPQGGIMMLSDTEAVLEADESAGNWVWGELWTTDWAASVWFYHDMADLNPMEVVTDGDEDYRVFALGDENVAGFVQVDDSEFETRWGGYIAVDDLDQTTEKAKQLGGEVFDVRVDQHGAGRVAVMADPSGAVFFVYELQKESTGETAP